MVFSKSEEVRFTASSSEDTNEPEYVDIIDAVRELPILADSQRIVLDTLYDYAFAATYPYEHMRARWIQVLDGLSLGNGAYVFETCRTVWRSGGGPTMLLRGLGIMLQDIFNLFRDSLERQIKAIRDIFGMDNVDEDTWGGLLHNAPAYGVLMAVVIANFGIIFYILTFTNAVRSSLGALILKVGSCDSREAWQLDTLKYVAASWVAKMTVLVAISSVDAWSIGLAPLWVLLHSLANALSLGTLLWHVSTAPRWTPVIIQQPWVAMSLQLFFDWTTVVLFFDKDYSSRTFWASSLTMFIMHHFIITLFSSIYAFSRVGRDWWRVLGGKCLSYMPGRVLLSLSSGETLPISDLIDEEGLSLLVAHQWRLTHAQLLVVLTVIVSILWFAFRQLASIDHNTATSVHSEADGRPYVIVKKRIRHFLRRYGNSGLRTFNKKPVPGMLVAIGRSGFSTIDYRNIANRPYGALSHRGHIFDGQKLTYRGAAYHATAYAQLQGNVGLWIDTYCMSRGGEACASTIREHRYYYERASFVAIAMDELTEDLVCRLGDMVTDPIRSALSLKTRSLCQYSDTQLSAFAQYFSGSDVMRSGWCAQEILSGQELAIFTDCGRVMEWPAVAAGLAYIHATSIYQRTAAARLVELRLHRKSFTTNWWPLHDLLIACKDVDNVDRLDILAGYVSENLEYACERTTETVRTWLCETLVFRSPEIMLLQGYNSVTPGEGWFGKLCDPESGSVEMPLGDMSNIDIKVCFVARSIGIRVYCRYMKLPTYTTKARKEGDDVELANVGGQKAVGWLHAPSVESNECLYLLLVGFSSSSLYAVVVDTSLSKRVGGCVVENDGSNMFDVSSWEKSEFTIA